MGSTETPGGRRVDHQFEDRPILVTGGSGFIGTHLVEFLTRRGARVVNIDIQAPLKSSQAPHWAECDIMDEGRLKGLFDQVRPAIVVHLAARTDCVEDTTVEDGYQVNTVGTENVVKAVSDVGTVERLVITSSQYVSGPHHSPKHVRDYGPHTVYGESKAQSEELTRTLDPPCVWTIVRPVNIWGPFHERYRREAWRVIGRGLYMHPGRAPVVRTYGYVGNVVWQIGRIVSLPREAVHGRVFYLGDSPDDIYRWVDEFSRQLTDRRARVVPRSIVRAVAGVGDLLRLAGFTPPLDSSRYRSMTTDYVTPMSETHEVLGPPPIDLQGGVARTVAWIRGEDVDLDIPEPVMHEPLVGDLEVRR